uniref:Kazal-like domain-containing protein n=1 Tax=Octopus bimaculoides TaxID=37653 RepID=A0A0L8FT05_OCTBM
MKTLVITLFPCFLLQMLFTALRDSDCDVNCTNIRRKTLCASDGLSYQTRCDIQRALQCKNWTVGTDHRRPCPILKETGKILEQKKKLMEKRRNMSRNGERLIEYSVLCKTIRRRLENDFERYRKKMLLKTAQERKSLQKYEKGGDAS